METKIEPLDVLKEAWEHSQNTDESVISYVLTIQERLESMAENMEASQRLQKQWYDKKAKDRDRRRQNVGTFTYNQLKVIGQVARTIRSELTVVKRMSKVNYLIDMHNKKRKRVFHVNLLKKFYVSQTVGLAQEGVEEENEDIRISQHGN